MPQFINASESDVVDLGSIGLGRVKPGESVEIEDAHAQPGRRANGSRAPSIIERMAPQLKPVDAAWTERVFANPAPEPEPVSRLRSVDGHVEAGSGAPLAPGVAAARRVKIDRKVPPPSKPDAE